MKSACAALAAAAVLTLAACSGVLNPFEPREVEAMPADVDHLDGGSDAAVPDAGGEEAGVVAEPRITAFMATPSVIPNGGTATLTGTFLNGQGYVDNGIGAVESGFSVESVPLANDATFALVVIGAGGKQAVAQASVKVVGQPDVTGLKATGADRSVALTWIDPANVGFDHVEVTCNGGTTSIAKGIQMLALTDLDNFTTYSFTLKTVNVNGLHSGGVSVEATPTDLPNFAFRWVERTVPGMNIANNGASVASSFDGLTLAVAAGGGSIFKSTDGGLAWIEKTGAGSRNWSSIAMSADGTRVAAAASGGFIYTSSDGGETWAEMTNVGSRAWSSIASSSDGIKLAATVAGGYIYTSPDGGTTWIERTGAGVQSWVSIASSADGARLVVGSYNNDRNESDVFLSIDGGMTWNISGCSASIVASSSDGKRIAAMSRGYSNLVKPLTGGDIYTSSDGGLSWILRDEAGSRFWSAMALSRDGGRYAAAEGFWMKGGIYLSTDGGANWHQEDVPQRNWTSVACAADFGRCAAVATNSSSIWVTE